MRDFRDAKTMAHTLRAALATKGLKVTVSQSLELIAQAFGVADWNTLSASIRREVASPRNPTRLSFLPPRQSTGPKTTPISESTGSRRWSISCSP